MKKTSHFVLLVLLQTGLSSADQDRKGESRRRPPKPVGPGFFENFLKHHDRNDDGRVSEEEFAAGERSGRLSEEARDKLFKRLDKDGDGFITAEDLKMKERKEANPFLERSDADRDGRISRKEFLAKPPFREVDEERLNRMFDRMDRNKDGFLDQKDRPAGREPGRPHQGPGSRRFPRLNLEQLDLDQSGGVNWNEFQKTPFLKDVPDEEKRRFFKRMDRNDDGEIQPDEVKPLSERGRPGPRK